MTKQSQGGAAIRCHSECNEESSLLSAWVLDAPHSTQGIGYIEGLSMTR
jgi:hypothetical protein